jgi:glycosyltransferase involved in cell wall biosynthesis
MIHCESNTGFAIGPLEKTFFDMALSLCNNDRSRVHFCYPNMQRGPSTTLPPDFDQYLVVDARSTERRDLLRAEDYIRKNNINVVFGFDQPVSRPIYRHLRRAGVGAFVSYWGAPMSSIQTNRTKLLLKRIDVALRRNGPDHYIFESQGMADTAVLGRGIPRKNTSVVHLGVDTHVFRPDSSHAKYPHELFGISPNKKIFFYSGHMEPRKGVAVIMRAANYLAATRESHDWHICLLGNRPGEEEPYVKLLSEEARNRVTFGGYRDDVPTIQRGCYAAIVASTGWDSFPRSAMEMQASGLPVLVSDLPGLREAVEPGKSGYRFRVDDDAHLASMMTQLLDDDGLRRQLSLFARQRIERDFSLSRQLEKLIQVTRSVAHRAQPRALR